MNRILPACLIVTAFSLAGLARTARQAEASAFTQPEMRHMEFLLGEWDFHATFPTRGGRGKGVYRSRVAPSLDGKSLTDTFCNLLPDGTVDPQGATVRTYDAASKTWRMLFFSANLANQTVFEGEFVEGDFLFEGKGHERGRKFIERVTFFNIQPDSYSWNMDRSYDGGATWIEGFFAYDAVRVKTPEATKKVR